MNLAADFSKPSIEYGLLSPILIVFGVALVGVVVEAFVARKHRYLVQTVLSVAGVLGALVATCIVASNLAPKGDTAGRGQIAVEGAIAVDGPTVFIWGTILALSLISVLLFAERHLEGGITAFAGQAAALPGTAAEREASTQGVEHTEVFPLMLFSIGGMLLFPASNDLLTLFVALEILSLPLYLLCGLARRRRLLSQEAALKYFMLGAFSSGFFLYGIALTYGYAGSMNFGDIAEAVSGRIGGEVLLLGGIGLLAVGLLFKIGAAPFHAWTPDVYQGAPTAVTGFMAACTKVAAFGALLRLFYVAFGGGPLGLVDHDRHHRGADHAGRLHLRDHPVRHQADAGLLLDRARRASSSSASSASRRSRASPVTRSPRSRRCCSTWSPTAS